MTETEIKTSIEKTGYVVIENVLNKSEIKTLKTELEKAIEKEAQYHGGRDYKDYGMVLICPLYGRSFIELLANQQAMAPFQSVLGEGCIVYAYTSSSMPPGQSNYSHRIHNDCPRLIPDYVTNMGGIFLLDDFNSENGATWFMPESHTRLDAPGSEEFFKKAKRLEAPAGSACYFNARIWHSGEKNQTQSWRHAVTINMCRPYMKQRIDLPRALSSIDLSGVPEPALQKLGFHSQVPASLEEYYLPLEKRKFKQKTE